MANYAIPAWLAWSTLVFMFMLMSVIVYLLWTVIKRMFMDVIIFLDKNSRWRMKWCFLKGQTRYKDGEKTYYLHEKAGLLSSGGKALYIFSENKPEPLMISFNKTSWLDSKSLTGIINNKLVQQIISPQDAFKDMLILIGACGAIVAGLASVIHLLIVTGVIQSVAGAVP